MNNMFFEECLYSRRTVSQYSDKCVPDEEFVKF